MAENSKIEWTDHTVNLWWGCAKVHTGCKNCYAEYFSDVRYKNNLWGEKGQRRRIKSAFSDLAKFQNKAKELGVMHKVFIGSMMDIFESSRPLSCSINGFHTTEDLRQELFSRITNLEYENLIFLFLTKRPENISYLIPSQWLDGAPNNVWFGTSVSDQETAEKHVPRLLKVKGNRFLSIEPQVDKVNLLHIDAEMGGDPDWCQINCLDGTQTDMGRPWWDVPKINWVIQGGESGSKKRPFNLDWAYVMKAQCEAVGVPYFFKQIDKVQPIPEDLKIRQFPKLFFKQPIS